MGYEIAGGLGVKLAAPEREVFVTGRRRLLPDDGARRSSPPCPEGIKLVIVLIQNHGFASIGALSEAWARSGSARATGFRNRQTGQLDGAVLPVDLAANAASLGCRVLRADGIG